METPDTMFAYTMDNLLPVDALLRSPILVCHLSFLSVYVSISPPWLHLRLCQRSAVNLSKALRTTSVRLADLGARLSRSKSKTPYSMGT